MSNDKVKIGVIGLGSRGMGILKGILLKMYKDGLIEILGVCDTYEDRAKEGAEAVVNAGGKEPVCSVDYRDIIAIDEIDAVMILSAWESHVEMSIAAMRAGKHVGLEVGGAYSIDECFRLVNTHEETGMHCMMLENCCYGRKELMVLNMVKKGVFGDIVHCSGGYLHDLREEIAFGDINRHYRQRNYFYRNCENYPTHELGPISKVLSINRGNRMLYLTSVASCAKGLHEFVVEKRGVDHPLAKLDVAQGDIVTTIIKCAGGQTIVLTLDTTLPRTYSRGFTVRGTKGMFCEDGNYIHMDGESEWTPVANMVNSADKYAEEYEHPIWEEYKNNPVAGHDGIDWLVYNAFVDSVKNNRIPPIDTYDTATWMCITPLSEESIAGGGKPVSIPDFTNGKWVLRTEEKQQEPGLYDL